MNKIQKYTDFLKALYLSNDSCLLYEDENIKELNIIFYKHCNGTIFYLKGYYEKIKPKLVKIEKDSEYLIDLLNINIEKIEDFYNKIKFSNFKVKNYRWKDKIIILKFLLKYLKYIKIFDNEKEINHDDLKDILIDEINKTKEYIEY